MNEDRSGSLAISRQHLGAGVFEGGIGRFGRICTNYKRNSGVGDYSKQRPDRIGFQFSEKLITLVWLLVVASGLRKAKALPTA